ncbi:MAG TPA: hypothetical protein VKY42_05015 [Trueperaceae bacterium]|nr:hypothetical protein [Trueperaceae bacterium]
MATFTIGEEVLYEGERYVITLRQPQPPYRYRLVRTTADGPEVRWALGDDLAKITAYTEPRQDTPVA